MKKKKVEVEEYELSLDKEEKILEGIRDNFKSKVWAHLSPSKECCNIKRIKQARKRTEREGNASSNLNIKVIWWYGSSCMT
jgi:hypothetical protein